MTTPDDSDPAPSEQAQTPDTAIWLVWSHEHQAWWRPNSAGYSRHLAAAGRYTKEEADRICEARDPYKTEGDPPPEVAVIAPEAFAAQSAELEQVKAERKETDEMFTSFGVPELHEDGTPLTALERSEFLIKSRGDALSNLATALARLAERDAQVVELVRDKERWDIVQANQWHITWSDRIGGFFVQKRDQVCGNIASHRDVRAAIDAATSKPQP